MTPEKNSEALNKALEFVIDNIEQGKDFLAEQGPLLVHDIIAYGRAYSTAVLVLSVLMPVICWSIFARFKGALDKDSFSYDGTPQSFSALMSIITAVISSGATIAGTICFLTHVNQCLQAWFAPRLYVLHELKGLL